LEGDLVADPGRHHLAMEPIFGYLVRVASYEGFRN
jgi:hypothetical protein